MGNGEPDFQSVSTIVFNHGAEGPIGGLLEQEVLLCSELEEFFVDVTLESALASAVGGVSLIANEG